MPRTPQASYDPHPPDDFRGQPFTVLGRTGLRVSRASFGTMTFGSQTDESQAQRMVDLCLDRGVNFFDTANVYNSGLSETILGRVLGERRDEVVLATKARYPMSGDPNDGGLSRTTLIRSCEESLARLGTDTIDLFYLHAPDHHTDFEETLLGLDILVRQGKIRTPAFSNFSAWQTCEALWIADRRNLAPPIVAQPMYNLLARSIEDEFLPFCRRHRIATCVYNPLCGGLLTGKHRFDRSTQAGSRFDSNPLYQERYWREAYFEAVEEASRIAGEGGLSPTELALRWPLGRPGVDNVILGASRLEQLEENLDAVARGPLPDDLVEACDGVWNRVRAQIPAYHR